MKKTLVIEITKSEKKALTQLIWEDIKYQGFCVCSDGILNKNYIKIHDCSVVMNTFLNGINTYNNLAEDEDTYYKNINLYRKYCNSMKKIANKFIDAQNKNSNIKYKKYKI